MIESKSDSEYMNRYAPDDHLLYSIIIPMRETE